MKKYIIIRAQTIVNMASPTKKVALAAWSEFAVTTHITNMTPVFFKFCSKYFIVLVLR